MSALWNGLRVVQQDTQRKTTVRPHSMTDPNPPTTTECLSLDSLAKICTVTPMADGDAGRHLRRGGRFRCGHQAPNFRHAAARTVTGGKVAYQGVPTSCNYHQPREAQCPSRPIQRRTVLSTG